MAETAGSFGHPAAALATLVLWMIRQGLMKSILSNHDSPNHTQSNTSSPSARFPAGADEDRISNNMGAQIRLRTMKLTQPSAGKNRAGESIHPQGWRNAANPKGCCGQKYIIAEIPLQKAHVEVFQSLVIFLNI
jgi:hypothetical protein